MVNINDLVLLEKEDEAKKALIMAISNKFQLYIIDRDKSYPRALLLSKDLHRVIAATN